MRIIFKTRISNLESPRFSSLAAAWNYLNMLRRDSSENFLEKEERVFGDEII